MSQHYPTLLVTVPLLAAFIISAAGWINKRLCFPFAVATLTVAAYSCVGLLFRVLHEGVVHYRLGGWPPPWGIAYYVDQLNGLVLSVISVSALINLIASKRSIEREFPEKIGPFYTLYVLFVTGMLGITVTGDAFNLYVLLEIGSLTGYALIAMGDKDRAPLASLNYLYMGTIGACFYLLGVGYLYIVTGSLNMVDIASILPGLYQSKAVMTAFIICMVGMWIKMAFFPLHGWLPNAYTFAPSASSSLIAPLMTKVMIYVMIRFILTVFTPKFAFSTLAVSDSVVWLAVIAIVMGAIFALAQRDLKKMLTYIIVAEVGYMVGGAWLGNRAGMTGAILHIVNDALMTLCAFLVVGNIVYKVKGYAFEDLKGLFSKMPFTMGAFVIGALSIIGVPPTCGFFSKWYLISGAIQASHYGFVVALLFSSLVNVVLFFRIIEIGYYEPFGDHHGHDHHPEPMAEAPLSMLVPLFIVAAGLVLVGLYTGDIVNHIIQFVIPKGLL
ncbi:MAG: monovalent cation/H+ antiporter subunit D family protein [Deltaproteobacteria bacterium]|nr:monovalent cation/H+ antiporter subunit D family protein [Deltaproteobacteria bacterium]MBW2019004.1 monovalent cation/H+ antiporter subunit D family protein [Deltaproteobacteria bacterium]MBW2073594.1 monovalent cation/H+ antiporter subunit D family protein [Deltaproteobacteria bacterium]